MSTVPVLMLLAYDAIVFVNGITKEHFPTKNLVALSVLARPS
jgi:hypothetical protein